jgi:hypothetical protein
VPDTPKIIETSELKPQITSITSDEEEDTGPQVPRIVSTGELVPSIVTIEEE